jgi:hypothetical protein
VELEVEDVRHLEERQIRKEKRLDNQRWVDDQNERYAATFSCPLGKRKDPVEDGRNRIRIMESRRCDGSSVE